MRESWCESELLQAIGRARGIRRTPKTPLELFILTNIPLPITVNNKAMWDDAVPVDMELLLAKNGAVAVAYNELMRTNPSTINKARTAVAKFKKRYPELNLGVVSPIYNTNRQNHTQFQFFKSLLLVQYTRAVKGSKPCKAVIHDHKSVSWREALKSITGDVKNITLIFRTAIDKKPDTSCNIKLKIKDFKPVCIATNVFLVKPWLNII